MLPGGGTANSSTYRKETPMHHNNQRCTCRPGFACGACGSGQGQGQGQGGYYPQTAVAVPRPQQVYDATERAITSVLQGGLTIVQQGMASAVGMLADGVRSIASSIGGMGNTRGGAPGCYSDTLSEIPSDCGVAGKQCDYRIPFSFTAGLAPLAVALQLDVPNDFVPSGCEYFGPPEAIIATIFIDDTFYARDIIVDGFFGTRLNQRFNSARVYPGKPLRMQFLSRIGFPVPASLQFTGLKSKV